MSTEYYQCTACGYRGVHAVTVGAGNFSVSAIAGDDTERTGEFRCPNCGAEQTFTESADMSQMQGVTPPLEEPTDLPSLGPTTAETMQPAVTSNKEAEQTAEKSTKGGK